MAEQVRSQNVPERKIIIDGNTALVPLTKSYTAVIDAADAMLVDACDWWAMPHGNTVYAVRTECSFGKSRSVFLHRVILGMTDPDIKVDHIDGDGLNCRRSNLRRCTIAQNSRNRRRPLTNTSGYKGVSWHSEKKKWHAQIGISGLRKHIGYYETAEEAHAAYCSAADKYHCEFARY